MSKRLRNEVFDRIQSQIGFEEAIVQAYISKRFLTKQIAETYGVTPRTVQRIVKKWCQVRSQADGNRVAAPLAVRHRVRSLVKEKLNRKGRSKDNQLAWLRHVIIGLMKEQHRDFNHCEQCGSYIPDGKFELHHTKYEGATFHDLLILCRKCQLLPENMYLT